MSAGAAAMQKSRHALNMPAGSVRAIHVLVMVLLAVAILWMPSRSVLPLPPFLVYLLFLVVGHFFAAHGVTIAAGNSEHPRPLRLPGGVVRLLIIVSLGGTLLYQYLTNPEGLKAQFHASLDQMKDQPYVPLCILGGFFLGAMVRAVVGRTNPSAWFQDVEAWISLLALLGLLISSMLHLVVNPTLEHPVSFAGWEGFMGAVVAFYFGERS
jgi:hypothetical protein